MRISVLLSLTSVGLVAATNQPGECNNGNNCYRAVHKTNQPDKATRIADCSSFLRGTYTTTPVTTKTYDEAFCPGGQHGAGGCPGGPTAAPVDPSITTWPDSYPTYLTSTTDGGVSVGKCTTVPWDQAPVNAVAASSSAYASACSCVWGVVPTVTTVVAPTFTACVNEPADKFKLKRKYVNWGQVSYKEVKAGNKFTLEDDGSKFYLAGEKTSTWKDLYTCDGPEEIKVRAKDGKLSTGGPDDGMTCKIDKNDWSNIHDDDLECKSDGKTKWKYELGGPSWNNQLALVSGLLIASAAASPVLLDCQSFLGATGIADEPPVATTADVTTAAAHTPIKRQEAPAIPAYAGGCTGDVASRYSSACSCLGVVASTTADVPPPATDEPTPIDTDAPEPTDAPTPPGKVPVATPTAFVLHVESGTYVAKDTASGPGVCHYTTDIGQAVRFSLAADGTLRHVGSDILPGTLDEGISNGVVIASIHLDDTDTGLEPIKCAVDGNMGIHCTSRAFTQFGDYHGIQDPSGVYEFVMGTPDTNWVSWGGKPWNPQVVAVSN
ncbi:hypothetical protein Dda_5623 [Drechslerella dactyloides]|uniref:Uncharacterized protein n=1 Tax=Drechslerella dactyloides TaxID=74499 RepID=A0AAD6IWI9_DREDA|nr:hypothetical protein Dda_5623 [Drechslerella dactyloides]